MAIETLSRGASNSEATVSAVWTAYIGMLRIANGLDCIPATDKCCLDDDHPVDVAGAACHGMLPLLLTIPARNIDEAIMQAVALTSLVSVEADGDQPAPHNSVELWRTALVSILRALAEGGALPTGMTAQEATSLTGRGAWDAIGERLAALSGIMPVAA